VAGGRLADELAALCAHIDVLPGAIDQKSHLPPPPLSTRMSLSSM
jgi:hypothetical protein